VTSWNLPGQPSADRSAGILLHPTSLPGPYGIGDLGPTAYDWVETLTRARQKWWQVLPLGPTGYGDSPYQSLSAFAGNIYLLSPEVLLHDGLLEQTDLAGVRFSAQRVEYEHVIAFKNHLLARAWAQFKAGRAGGLRAALDDFRGRHDAAWLADYALFKALKEEHADRSWQEWPAKLVRREPGAIDAARQRLADEVDKHRFGQFLFFRQWQNLKAFANSKGVRLIGDVPIFVASDSADVWANPELFTLDDQRRPTVVAGVPPDYFSATGQLWGNPLYRWDVSRQSGHRWWAARMRATLELVDFVRIDHFRGFEAYWEIPSSAPTAQTGQWIKGPGIEFFDVLRQALGSLPLIAEDLGLITPEVEALRDKFGLPGMRVLQFAFGDTPKNLYLPHNYVRNTVAYTGTHDNDTTEGWYATRPENERALLHRYMPIGADGVARGLMRLAWASVADYAIAPLQDLLRLGSEARMNTPGLPAGNWCWRMQPAPLPADAIEWLAEITELFGR
jgi:4-alpha-glucanotransferase